MKDKRSTLIIIVLVMIGMTWLGYRLRMETEGSLQMDKEADEYFEKLDSLKHE